MNFEVNFEATLAIETDCRGGSLALLLDGKEIYSWSGKAEISKSEDILEQISKMLRNNRAEPVRVGNIIVANGEGSVTGGRIGMAIAKGLAKSFGSRLIKMSIFEALLQEIDINSEDGKYAAAIRFGYHRLRWQSFIKTGKRFERDSASEILDIGKFAERLQSSDFRGYKKVVFARAFLNSEEASLVQDQSIIISNRCPAELMLIAYNNCSGGFRNRS